MSTVILLFALAFLAGGAAQHGRLGPSPASKKVGWFIAIAFTLIYFGYAVGKGLAQRDNLTQIGSTSSVSSGQSPIA